MPITAASQAQGREAFAEVRAHPGYAWVAKIALPWDHKDGPRSTGVMFAPWVMEVSAVPGRIIVESSYVGG